MAEYDEEFAKDLGRRRVSILDAVHSACIRSGRSPEDVALVAVSKKHPAESIRALAGAGQSVFGESYVQEALAKQEELAELSGSVRWHFLGGLQTNKARQAAGRFALIHSVDSLKLASKLSARAVELSTRQPVLLQANLAREMQKSGADPGELAGIAEEMAQLEGLDLQGLMILPPYLEDPEKVRPYFAGLRRLRDELEKRLGLKLPHLSMGMSHDYVQAVEEGATLIRVGTALFGPRPY